CNCVSSGAICLTSAMRLRYMVPANPWQSPMDWRTLLAPRESQRWKNFTITLACGDFPISEAVDQVIVHHSYCLHVCVYGSGTHEAESALFQVLAERIGFGGAGGNLLRGPPAVHFGLSADKAPRVPIESSELLL